MLEGGGKTPILSPSELQEVGYKLVGYPLSLIGVSIRAMENALIALKGGRIPSPGSLPSFEEIKETVGFNEYYREEERYKISGTLKSSGQIIQEQAGEKAEKITDPVVGVISPVYNGSGDSSESSSGLWSRTLRLKITGSDESEKLNVRIPAKFLEGMANTIPGLLGKNVMELLENAALEGEHENGKLLIDFTATMGDRVQVFVE